jgi:hypothetical protein
LLLLPPEILAQAGLAEFASTYRPLLAGISGLLAGLLVLRAAYRLTKLARAKRSQWRLTKSTQRTLLDLEEDEKVFLREFIAAGENTVFASTHNEIARRLENKEIIYRTSYLLAPGGRGFQYGLESHMREVLDKDPSWLES